MRLLKKANDINGYICASECVYVRVCVRARARMYVCVYACVYKMNVTKESRYLRILFVN